MITIGSATVDFFVVINKKYKYLKHGAKILAEENHLETGGAATNAAVSLSRLGLKVKVLTKLGNDNDARTIEKQLKKENVSLFKIKHSRIKTPFSVILISKKDRDRIVFSYKGSCDYLSNNDFRLNELNTKWLYLGTLLKESFKVLEDVSRYALKKKIKVLFNPSTYLAAKGKKYLKTVLRAATILVVNKEEASLILNKKTSVAKLLIGLKNLGPDIVVITDGKNKLHAIDERCTYIMKPYKTKIISTLGAGDAFASGFLGAYIKTGNTENSIRYGLANSASVLQHYSAKRGLMTFNQATKFIRKHKSKLEEYCKI